MNAAIASEQVQGLLNRLNAYEPPTDPFRGDIWQDVILAEDGYSAELTECLCSSEQADFIIKLDDVWWNFDCNEQTREWEAYCLGASMTIKISEKMVGEEIDMNALAEELSHELPGMEVLNTPSVHSLSEEMRLYFGDKIDEKFQDCVETVLNYAN